MIDHPSSVKRQARLQSAVEGLHRRFGSQSVVKGQLPSSSALGHQVRSLSTGIAALDVALGIGGLPMGKVSEFVGAPTSGKTTLALNCLAQAQSGNNTVGYIDPGHSFDPDYAHRCGLDLSRLIVGAPDDDAEAQTMVDALAGSGILAVLVLDWTGISASLSGLPSRLGMSLARTGTVLIVLRDWLGSAHTMPATRQACVRLGVWRERWQRYAGDITGCQVRVEVLKNRFAQPSRCAHVSLTFDA